MMSTQLLEIQPRELKFIFELRKQSSCAIKLTNNTYSYVAFKVKTTSPKKYCVRPNVGVLMPKSTCEFTVTMQAQKVAPPDMVCKDKFLIQSTAVPVGTTENDITASMFSKENGRYIEDVKLKVALISPPESPVLSPINGVLKKGPFFESAELKEPLPSQVETVPAHQTIDKDVEHKMSGQEFIAAKDVNVKPKTAEFRDQEFNAAKDVDWKTKKDEFYDQEFNAEKDVDRKPKKDEFLDQEFNAAKDVDWKPKKAEFLDQEFIAAKDVDWKPKKAEFHDQEFSPVKDTDLKSKKDDFLDHGTNPTNGTGLVDVANGVEMEPTKIEQLKTQDTAIDEHEKLKEAEAASVGNVEYVPPKVVSSVEELKLVSDIEEMKLKLNAFESKLNEAETSILKLTEDRRLSVQERKSLREEVAVLRSRINSKKVQAGFPVLFVVMVALIGIFLGYMSQS